MNASGMNASGTALLQRLSKPLASPRLWLAGSAICLLGFLAPGLTLAQGITDLEVRRDEITGRIRLDGGQVTGSFSLSFEEAFDLNSQSFDISAQLIDPRSPSLRDRLPENVFIPSQFPVLLTIEPRERTGFSFRGRWSLEVRTPHLEFSSHTPLRLFRAPKGTAFSDISQTMGFGSYRVRALGAAFSEFLIVSDLRTGEEVADQKLTRLLEAVESRAQDFPGPVLQELLQRLEEIEKSFDSGELPAALDQLDDLLLYIVEISRDQTIPDITNPDRGLIGLGATLRALASSLRFSIDRIRQQAVIGQAGISRTVQVEDGLSFDLEFSFDEAFDVDLEDLQISAERIDVKNAAFNSRLPDGVEVPEDFPVLIRINPSESADQGFCGTWSLEIRTDQLRFLGGTPYRLFKAPDGGAFEDVTETVGHGSYRVRALGAAFSEFVIGIDTRPIEEIVGEKLDQLSAILMDNTQRIPPLLLQSLINELEQFGAALDAGQLGQALDALDRFLRLVRDNARTNIPAIWRSTDETVNVAGQLEALGQSLRFSLEVQQTPLFGNPADVNRDGRANFNDVLTLLRLLRETP